MRKTEKSPLSICIPTYNGRAYLGKLLKSLELQRYKDIEVVVSDDASSDGTAELIKKWQRGFPNIRLFQNRRNLGFDGNMVAVAKRACGEYCWYMGQDDYLRPGAIHKVRRMISKRKPSLVMTNFARFDNQRRRFTATRMIEGRSRTFFDAQDYYFKRTRRSYFPFLGVNLIYISILVFARDRWLQALENTPKRYFNSDYFHTFVMTRLIADHQLIEYCSKPLVVYRDKNIRQWTNKDIWGHYVKAYLPYTRSLGWNPLKVKYAQWVVSIHNRPKRGALSNIRSRMYGASAALRRVLGMSQM